MPMSYWRLYKRELGQRLVDDFWVVIEDKAVSILTLDLVIYCVEKDKFPRELIKVFVECFNWIPIVDADAQWAFTNFNGDDFEDALQIACAVGDGCNSFATLRWTII